MITYEKRKGKTVICKDGSSYMAFTDDQLIELSSVINEIIPNNKQVREVLTIDNCIAYLFKNKSDLNIDQAFKLLQTIKKILDI